MKWRKVRTKLARPTGPQSCALPPRPMSASVKSIPGSPPMTSHVRRVSRMLRNRVAIRMRCSVQKRCVPSPQLKRTAEAPPASQNRRSPAGRSHDPEPSTCT
eukprot:scaffold7688_cov130-Isochrysis_galbana.AAC.8